MCSGQSTVGQLLLEQMGAQQQRRHSWQQLHGTAQHCSAHDFQIPARFPP